jgi:osmotically-inducible protein OsmY
MALETWEIRDMKSDIDLRDNVKTEIGYERSIASADVEVDVDNGRVTLTGQVGSPEQRAAAERAAQRVAGPENVCCEINVVPATPGIVLTN